MNEIDFFGFCFYAFIFAGMWFLKHKVSIGWIYRLVGEIGWFGIGIYINMPSIWVCSLFFAWLDYQGFFHWEQEDKSESNAWTDEEIIPFSYDKPMWEIQPAMNMNEPVWTFTVEEKKNGKNKNVKRKGKSKKVAAKPRRSRKGKVQPTRRRRSVKTNGKPRRRFNDVAKSTKRSRN
jgi:hypothetical protein